MLHPGLPVEIAYVSAYPLVLCPLAGFATNHLRSDDHSNQRVVSLCVFLLRDSTRTLYARASFILGKHKQHAAGVDSAMQVTPSSTNVSGIFVAIYHESKNEIYGMEEATSEKVERGRNSISGGRFKKTQHR